MLSGANARYSSSCDPGGYRMARGWRYTKLSLSRALLLVLRAYFVFAPCASVFILFYGLPAARPCILPIFCWHLLFCVVFVLFFPFFPFVVFALFLLLLFYYYALV